MRPSRRIKYKRRLLLTKFTLNPYTKGDYFFTIISDYRLENSDKKPRISTPSRIYYLRSDGLNVREIIEKLKAKT